MRRARHTSLAVALGLALSLLGAGAASAADFTLPASVNPNQPITVSPTLTVAEALDAQVVRFTFTNDVELVDSTSPFGDQTFQDGYASAGTRTVTMQVESLVADDVFVSHTIRVNAAPGRVAFRRNVPTPNVGQAVRFDAGNTTDDAALDNDSFDWDFDNNGSYETQNSRVVNRQLRQPRQQGRDPARDRLGRPDGHVRHDAPRELPAGGCADIHATDPVRQRPHELHVAVRRPGRPARVRAVGPGRRRPVRRRGRGHQRRAASRSPGCTPSACASWTSFGRVSTAATTFNVLAADRGPAGEAPPLAEDPHRGLCGRKRIRVDLLTVSRLRKGATVKVRCSGKGCPRRKAVSTRANDGLVRLRWLERRLRPGTRLYFAITYPGKIGRYERILLRKRKEPTRRTQCLWPGEPKARTCS